MRVIVQPKIEPVSIAEVKEQIGISETDSVSDALITRRIVEARQWAEGYTGRAFISQTREIRWDCFVKHHGIEWGFFGAYPDIGRDCHRARQHDLPSAVSIVSVKYIDPNGTEQTLDPSNYVFDSYSPVPCIRAAYEVIWPDVRYERNAVRIQFIAGYGASVDTVPPLIKEAIILLVGHWMNFQPQSESGVTMTRVPYAVRDMLDTFKTDFL